MKNRQVSIVNISNLECKGLDYHNVPGTRYIRRSSYIIEFYQTVAKVGFAS